MSKKIAINYGETHVENLTCQMVLPVVFCYEVFPSPGKKINGVPLCPEKIVITGLSCNRANKNEKPVLRDAMRTHIESVILKKCKSIWSAAIAEGSF